MTENTKKKKPLSLNERHSRLLRDLSSSHRGEEKNQPKFNLDDFDSSSGEAMNRPNFNLEGVVDDDDVPRFSGIADFDSSTDDGKNRPNFNFEGVDEDDDDAPRFSGIADFDSSTGDGKNKPNFDLEDLGEGDDDVPRFSGVDDVDNSAGATNLLDERRLTDEATLEDDGAIGDNFNSTIDETFPEKETTKLEKVKIAGRRRLCKVSLENDDHQSDSHQFQDISDFTSPPRAKNLGSEVNDGGESEIRDILNDLSAKLGFLSIDKKKNPRLTGLKSVPFGDDSLRLARDKHGDHKKDDLGEHEYASAGSSFSGSNQSDSSSSVIGGALNKEAGVETLSESEGDNFGGAVEPKKNIGDGGLRNVGYSLGGAVKPKNVGEGESRNASYSFGGAVKPKNVGERDLRNASYSFGGAVKPKIVGEGESRAASCSFGGAVKPKDVDKGQLRKMSKKVNEDPTVSRRKLVTLSEDDDDDEEDDCVVLGSGKMPRKVKKHDGPSTEDYGDPSVVQVLADDDNRKVSEDEHAIILTGTRSTYKLPAKIGKMLYPHQRDGLKWLWSLHCQGKGGILGDDMGLGKTMQISGYLAGLFNSRLIKRVMIVAPKTLIPHWIKELSVVGLSQKIREYFGTCPKLRQYELQYVLQDKGILLTTYDIVRNNEKKLCGSGTYEDEDEDGPVWDYMILDEGHLIKNPSTQRAKSLLAIPCAHRIIISGTPIQNNLKELWALFNFSCPELLGDKQWFKEKYEHPILRGNDKKASERDKRVGSMVAKELREKIQPYFLRRLKSEVFREDGAAESAKLSKKNEIIVWLRLTNCQRHLYEAFLKSEIVLSAFDGSPLAAITILKKICDHPYLLTKRAAEDLLEGMDSMLDQQDRGLAEKLAMHAADLTHGDDLQEKHDNISCKISFILSLLEKLIPEGHNVLIFSQTRKMLNLIQESLVANGFEFLRIDGTTKASDRLKIVNEFQEGHGAPIFLLTSQVGGLGLTLTRADRVIVVDPAWNPSTDNQSVDRAYRIGQKKDVIVYRLMTCGTIEEKIYRMQVFKGGLFKTATEHKEQTRYFSQQDLKELFSLPKDGFDISPTQLQLHAEHDHQISMSEFLKTHIKFLESLGIGGVSHHSLLYSKTEPAPAPVDHVEEDAVRKPGAVMVRRYGSSSTERPVDCSQYAFKPADVNLHKRNLSPQTPAKMTESEIKERISRLSQILSNKATLLRLPDRGEKIRKQIGDLRLELENINKPKKSNEVIELDDIADDLQRSLHV